MSSESISILLVEDHDADRRHMAQYLVRLGYFVIEASTGSEALNLIRELDPDVIISDLMMPEIGGIELLEAVKEDFPLTPFIIVSGLGTMEDVINGLRLGAWDYLTKPIFPIELLKHSLDKVLERVYLVEKSLNHQEYLEDLVKQRTSDLLSQNKAYEKEIKKRQTQEKLAKAAENDWIRTVDALPDMIVIIDRHRKIRRLNKPMLEMLGKTKEELIGQTCFFCGDRDNCLHEDILGDASPHSKQFFFEERKIYFDLNVVPYKGSDGEMIGSIHVFRDITDQKAGEKEKEILQAKLLHAQKLESVGQLASGIAHEINTPTQFISSNVSFIEEAFIDIQTSLKNILAGCSEENVSADLIRSELDDADWDYLEKEVPIAISQSQEGLIRVSSIVRAMKEFSHPGNKESEDADINHIIEVTVTVARNEWKYVSDVDLVLDKDLPAISCLSDEIGQVILNLLVNAAHAIAEKLGRTPDQEKGKITIQTFREEDWLTISISDTGAGIPKHLQDKIFDPFFTTKTVGQGTGQGLAIAYDVVANKHKGKLSFQTRKGEGSTFLIKLPINIHTT